MMEKKEISLKLTKDEALILFEFVSRFNENDNKEIFNDQAEEKIFWVIEGQLEKILVEPFIPNYQNIIQEARSRIRDVE